MAKRGGSFKPKPALESRYIIGIDLGTTDSALAYLDLQQGLPGTDSQSQSCRELLPVSAPAGIQVLEIPQVVRPGAVEGRTLLPSCVYLPAADELPPGSLALPWDEKRGYAVGEFARNRGREVPGRLASAAKSWLCQPHVDPRAPRLPLGAPEDVDKLSPVEVSARILRHLREAWDATLGKGQKGCELKRQKIYLCVPASFDAAARELTVEAARAAGFGDVTLLEEPQAAFYAWLESTGGQWRTHVQVGDLVLVMDIGGGTTDFTLIAVGEEKGALTLHRIAVGEHILLGGDNMDLALAHAVAGKLADSGFQIDSWQLQALAHNCREEKERLL
ncbi:MAG: Hsp70 family protein, partial [Planctomycetota bacterium]